MNKEKKAILKNALDGAKTPYTFSEKSKMRFLERIPLKDKEMRNFFYAWLSYTTSFMLRNILPIIGGK